MASAARRDRAIERSIRGVGCRVAAARPTSSAEAAAAIEYALMRRPVLTGSADRPSPNCASCVGRIGVNERDAKLTKNTTTTSGWRKPADGDASAPEGVTLAAPAERGGSR